MSGNHIHHIVAGECGGSVKADQVHRAQLWGDVEGHAWAVVCKAIGSVRCLTAADIRGSAVASVAKRVQKGEFTEKAAIRCGRKRLVGARVETHPAVSTKQEGTSHCFIGDNVYTYYRGRGRCIVVVKLNGHPGLSVCAE